MLYIICKINTYLCKYVNLCPKQIGYCKIWSRSLLYSSPYLLRSFTRGKPLADAFHSVMSLEEVAMSISNQRLFQQIPHESFFQNKANFGRSSLFHNVIPGNQCQVTCYTVSIIISKILYKWTPTEMDCLGWLM